EANMRAALANDFAQRPLTLAQRLLAQIDAVEAHEIEGHEHDGVGASLLKGGDQRRKLADAVFVEHDGLAVDQRAARFEGCRLAGDRREFLAPVEAGAGIKPRPPASRRQLQAVPVIFKLVYPFVALGRRRRDGAKLRRDKGGECWPRLDGGRLDRLAPLDLNARAPG